MPSEGVVFDLRWQWQWQIPRFCLDTEGFSVIHGCAPFQMIKKGIDDSKKILVQSFSKNVAEVQGEKPQSPSAATKFPPKLLAHGEA